MNGTRASADEIYRPFFTAGILITLTLGVSWGAYLLRLMATRPLLTIEGLRPAVGGQAVGSAPLQPLAVRS